MSVSNIIVKCITKKKIYLNESASRFLYKTKLNYFFKSTYEDINHKLLLKFEI